MSQENLEAVRGLFAAFSAGGSESLAALEHLDPDVELQDHPFIDSAWHHGYAGAVEWAAKAWEVFKDPVVRICEPMELDDARLLVRYETSGVGRLSGVPISDSGWALFKFRSGKIVRGAAFRSRQEALEAAGLSE